MERWMHSLALLEFKTPSAQKPSWVSLALLLSCSSPHLLSCTSVLVRTRHHPSTSTASLAKRRKLRRGRFTRPCIYTSNKTNGRNASRRWRWIPPCCGASCLTYYVVLVNARKPVIRFGTPHAVENSCFERPRYGRPAELRRQPRSSSIPLRSVTSKKASSTARQERTTQYTMCETRLKIYGHQARSKRASSV
jgi:hypothetical protein